MLSQPPSRLMWVWSDDHLREMVWMTFHRCLTFELNINSHVYKSPPQDPFFVILLGRLLRNGWELNLSSRTFCLSFTKSVPSCHQNSNDQSISTESDVHASTPLNRDLGLVIHHCRRWWQTICNSTPTHCDVVCLSRCGTTAEIDCDIMGGCTEIDYVVTIGGDNTEEITGD